MKMADYGAPLLPASAFAAAAIHGAITFLGADDPTEERSRQRGRVAANRALAQREVADDDAARGWSSAVPERGLALRRRGGLVRAAGEERGCPSEGVAAAGAHSIGAEAAVAKVPSLIIDPVAFFYVAVL